MRGRKGLRSPGRGGAAPSTEQRPAAVFSLSECDWGKATEFVLGIFLLLHRNGMSRIVIANHFMGKGRKE